LKNRIRKCWVDSTGSGQGPVASSCEEDNAFTDSTKSG
jgi:hypothetical protein